MFATEFEITLPKGYIDTDGNLHRKGTMRLSTAIDEISPLRDPRVKANPAYATIIILARVITRLGALSEVTPAIVENFFSQDLNYLQDFYRQINGLEPVDSPDLDSVTSQNKSPNLKTPQN
jgi:hypothetical protein